MFKNINIISIFILFAYLLCYANTKVCYVKMPKENKEQNQEQNQQPCDTSPPGYGCACSPTDNESCKRCCGKALGCGFGAIGDDGRVSGYYCRPDGLNKFNACAAACPA